MTVADQIVFVQVSDCHIGRFLANRDYPVAIDAAFGDGSAQPSHDVDLCKAFIAALDDVRQITGLGEKATIPVVMSGDLTASGDPTEFAVAHSFFRSHWRLRREDVSPSQQAAGLSADESVLAAVPGNHDNWYGRGWAQSPSYNKHLYPNHFEPTPWNKIWPSQHGTLRLYLVGLDSNSGLPPGSNRLAKGAIDPTQLATLAAPPPPDPDPDVVTFKAIVMHHSPAYIAPRRKFHALELQNASREALLDAAAANGYAAVLTGHTHDPFHHPFHRTVGAAERVVHELRCASTFQAPPQDGRQGFILHRLHASSGGYRWATIKYVSHENRFVREPDSARWQPFPLA
jgi:hypothetical protein